MNTCTTKIHEKEHCSGVELAYGFKQGGRHGILYNSSAIPKRECTGFHKMCMIFTLFRMVFHVLNVSNYVEKTE
jgi:hypothetical protein